MDEIVIVSRHEALVKWLEKQGISGEVVSHVANADQIRGKVVVGNLPLGLAAEAKEVWSVDMEVPPERRGSEMTLEDMEAFGARLAKYKVLRI